MNNKTTISPGDPQPIDCPNCEDKHGYQITNYIKIHYTDVYNEDGTVNSGFYGEAGKVIWSGKTAQCVNCGTKLPNVIIDV
jgi:ssDNA-binding Zn-finger/Zn-ribbon topoisomerase 1